jgi:peptidyl-tRNA hydrolase
MLHWACIRRYFTGPQRLFKGECLTSFSPFFLLCPFAKCNTQFIVTRIASAFYGPSLFCFFTHICLLSCFISFFWIFCGKKRWEMCSQVKVVTKVESEEEMLSLQNRAKSMKLPCHITIDAGRTQIAPNSRTVMAILGPSHLVDEVTGSLKLL